MNLFFLAICNVVLVTFSICVPRTSKSNKTLANTNFQNYGKRAYNNTALEVLEHQLLQPATSYDFWFKSSVKPMKKLRKRRRKPFPKRHISQSQRDGCKISSNSEKPKLLKHKKSFKRSFEAENMYWDAITLSSSLESSIDDFFGLFVSNTSEIPSTTKLKSSVPMEKTSKSSITPTENINTKMTTPLVVSKHILENADKLNQGMGQSVESQSNFLFNVQPGNVRDDLQNFFKQESEDENNDHKSPLQEIPVTHDREDSTESILGLLTSSAESSEINKIGDTSSTEVIDGDSLNLMPHSYDKTSMTSSSDKKECESHQNKKCVCSFASLKSDFENMFLNVKNPKEALGRVRALHCRHYVPVLDMFVISTHSKQKDIDKEKKAIAVNEEKGPKEVEQSSLDEFISQSGSEEGDCIINVFAGSDVKIPCFPTGGIHLLSSDADSVHYKWTHRNHKPITEGNTKENSDGEGTLSMEELKITDSDNYTCEVEYINPDTGHFKQESYVHSLSVVSLPILTVHVLVHYSAAQCGNSVTDMFRRYLPVQVETLICDTGNDKHLCSVDIHNAVCVDSSEHVQTKATKEISLNYEVHVYKRDERLLTTSNSSLCDANCHLVVNLKLLQLFKESMREVVNIPVSLDMNISGVYSPIASSVKIKYIFGCLAGNFYKGQGFCMACPKGTFSEPGAIFCTKCPAHSYQANMGASKCIPCSVAWIPACSEYFEETNKWILVIVVVVILLVLLVIILWFCFGTRERREANLRRLERDKRLGKSQKSVRRKKKLTRKESTEMQRFLDSSPSEVDTAAEESDHK